MLSAGARAAVDAAMGPVFGLLCRLTADRRRAEALAVRALAVGAHGNLDLGQMLEEARRLYVADAESAPFEPPAGGDDPIATMSPQARVGDEGDPESRNAGLWRSRDMWLDDDTRDRIRQAIARGDGNIFAAGSASPTTPDQHVSAQRPQRRKMVLVWGAVTVAAVVAVAASLVVDSGTEPSAGNAASSSVSTTTTDPEVTEPETTVTRTTADIFQVETTMRESNGPPGYVLSDNPEGFAFGGAWENTGGIVGGPVGWLEAWTSADADRSAGRWIVMATSLQSQIQFSCCDVKEGGSRFELNGSAAIVSTDADGVSDLVTVTDEGQRINIRSFGVGIEELMRLAAGTTVLADEAPRYDEGATAVLAGLQRAVSRGGAWGSVDSALYEDIELRQVYYTSIEDPRLSLIIATTRAVEGALLFSRLLRNDPAIQAVQGRVVQMGDRTVLVSAEQWIEGGPPTYFAQFVEDDDLVTIAGQVPFDVLTAVVVDSSRAAERRWSATLSRQPDPISTDFVEGGPPLTLSPIGVPTAGDVRWEFYTSADPPTVQITRLGSESSGPILQSPLGDGRNVQTYATLEATLLVVILADAGAATSLLFTPEGATPAIVPFEPLRESTAVGATFAYDTYGPCLIQLVDANGSILGELSA